MTTAAGVTYTYDGDGGRVEKSSGTLYWRNSAGQAIEETDASGNVTSDDIFFAGRRIAQASMGSIDVRFTNDSCSACGGNSVGGGDRNLFINSVTVGSTAIYPSDPSVSYTAAPCNGPSGLYCTGDMIINKPVGAPGVTITVNAFGSPDYSVYPQMEVLLDGQLLGTWTVTGTAQDYSVTIPATAIQYFFADLIGSARAVTDSSGNTCFNADYYPHGRENDYSASCSPTYKFTGKERDSESGLDNFGSRYFTSSMGRFMSPDPSTALPIRVISPQRWNQYSYAIDNPLSYTDPTGEDAAAVNFSGMVAGQGHEALLIIDKDGSTTFASFGPTNHGLSNWLGANGSGLVTTASSSGAQPQLPTVQLGANGLPTADSYKALVNKLAAIENVDPKTVRLNYFQTSEADTQALKTWVSLQQQNAAAGTGPLCWYNVGFNNCADFTVAGLFVGNALSQQQVNSLSMGFRPNSLFNELAPFQNDEFDLMQIQKQKACVTVQGNNGPETTCTYD